VGAAAAHTEEALTVRIVLVAPDGLQPAAFHLDQHSAKCWMAIHGTHGPHDFRSGHGYLHSGHRGRSYRDGVGRNRSPTTVLAMAAGLWLMPRPGKRRKADIGARERRRVGCFALCNISWSSNFCRVFLGLVMPSDASTACADQSADELRRELAESREQQAATAGILRGISSSPTDMQGVFQEIAASAARLCQAYDAVIRQVDGDALLLVAHHGPLPVAGTLPLLRGHLVSRAVLEGRTIHVADLQTETDEYPEG